METPLELRLRQLVHRVDELHINLQKVSSKTLSNSRTTSLEDRLHTLEQGQIPEVTKAGLSQLSFPFVRSIRGVGRHSL